MKRLSVMVAALVVATLVSLSPPDCQAGIFNRRVTTTPQYGEPATPVVGEGQHVELPAPTGRWQLAVFLRSVNDPESVRLCAELNDDARLQKLQAVTDVTVYFESDPMYQARYAAATGGVLPAMWLTDPDGNPAIKVSGQNIPFGRLGDEVQRSLDSFASNQPAYASEGPLNADCCRPRPKPVPVPPSPPVTTTTAVPDMRPTPEQTTSAPLNQFAGFGALAVVLVVIVGGVVGLQLGRRSIK